MWKREEKKNMESVENKSKWEKCWILKGFCLVTLVS
jgi:hypothetical protein